MPATLPKLISLTHQDGLISITTPTTIRIQFEEIGDNNRVMTVTVVTHEIMTTLVNCQILRLEEGHIHIIGHDALGARWEVKDDAD